MGTASADGAPDERIRITADLPAGDAAELRAALHRFNEDVTGFGDGAGLGCVLRDPDGTLLAGLDGFSWGGYARLEYLWVAPGHRGRGLGARLVGAALAEAAARGCEVVVVDTHTFQAPGFYERFGFVEVGRTRGTPRGHDQVLYALRLSGPAGGRAPTGE